MKIAIDARFYGPEGTGIGRYLENLLNCLSEIDDKNEYVVLLRKANYNLFNPKKGNFKKVLTDAPWYSVKEQILVPAVLAREKPDLVHFPHINVPLLWGGKFVLTIHDLTISEFGGKAATTRFFPLYKIKNLGYKVSLNQAIKKAKKLFVPSNFVSKKISSLYPSAKEKLAVTYEAVDKIFLEEGVKKTSEGRTKQVLKNYGVGEPYLIYVGNLFPYKNIEVVFKALKKDSSKLSLIVVGKRNKFTELAQRQAKDLGIEKRVNFVGFVPNEDLAVLYQKAQAFVFPSLSEGFGLPGLEAMACGCPVLAADSSSLPEVYGKAALFFKPNNPKDLTEKIALLNEGKHRKELIKKGFEQMKKYSWEKMARETLSVYEQIHEEKKKQPLIQIKKVLFFMVFFFFVFLGAFYFVQNISKDPTTAIQASTVENRFIVFGDSGTGSPEQKKIATLMEKESPQFLLHTGDVAYLNGSYDQIKNYVLDIYGDFFARTPFYPTLGNHDVETDDGEPLIHTFNFPGGSPYYSFSKGGIFFVSLDTNGSLNDPSGKMLSWLDQTLTQADGHYDWTVVYFHFPPYSSGIVLPGVLSVRDKIVPILEKHDVDIVFSGHDHNYQRTCPILENNCQTNGIVYIVTGGGGAPLHEIQKEMWFTAKAVSTYHFVLVVSDRCNFDLKAINLDGKVFDQTKLKKC